MRAQDADVIKSNPREYFLIPLLWLIVDTSKRLSVSYAAWTLLPSAIWITTHARRRNELDSKPPSLHREESNDLSYWGSCWKGRKSCLMNVNFLRKNIRRSNSLCSGIAASFLICVISLSYICKIIVIESTYSFLNLFFRHTILSYFSTFQQLLLFPHHPI